MCVWGGLHKKGVIGTDKVNGQVQSHLKGTKSDQGARAASQRNGHPKLGFEGFAGVLLQVSRHRADVLRTRENPPEGVIHQAMYLFLASDFITK